MFALTLLQVFLRIEDSTSVDIVLGGNSWEAGEFVHQFRIRAMAAHLGPSFRDDTGIKSLMCISDTIL